MTKENAAPNAAQRGVDKSRHPFQPVVDELLNDGRRITVAAKPYRLLWEVALLKGQYMQMHAKVITRVHGLSPNKVQKLAREHLLLYINSGKLIVPNYFKYQEGTDYQHDGDATANRNVWKANRKVYTKRDANAPVVYGNFNTKKK